MDNKGRRQEKYELALSAWLFYFFLGLGSSGAAVEWRAAGPFEEVNWSGVSRAQRFRCNKIRVLQSKPAAQSGMACDVGEHHPARSGRERPVALERALLEFVVHLEEIVEPQHE